jgi:hypothetical protein
MQDPKTTLTGIFGGALVAGVGYVSGKFHIDPSYIWLVVGGVIAAIGKVAKDAQSSSTPSSGGSGVGIGSTAKMLMAFALVAFIVLNSAACNASQLQKVVAQSDNVVQQVQTLDPLGQLVAEKLIDSTEAAIYQPLVNDFASAWKSFDSGLSALVKANPKANLASVAPLLADALAKLSAIASVKFTNAKANLRLEQIIGAIRIAATFVAAFFASQMQTAIDLLDSPLPGIDRAVFAMNGVKYDRKKIRQARAIANRDQAVCYYFDLPYDGPKLAVIRSYARS